MSDPMDEAPLMKLRMKSKSKFKSDAFEAMHSAVSGMFRAGSIDEDTMRRFDQSCLVSQEDAEVKPSSKQNVNRKTP